MEEDSRNIIAVNVKLVRELLGLTQLNFSIATEISRATLINIESGKTGYNLNLLDKIGKFTGQSLSELSSAKFNPREDIREQLIDRFRKTNSGYYNILSKKPDIIYAIKYKLLKGSFFDKPREVKHVRREIVQVYNWDYKSSSISNTLSRIPDLLLAEPHHKKLGTKVYIKR